MTRDEARALDAADPLGFTRARFALPAGTIYLDGNSLGALPAAAPARLALVAADEWGEGLIGSWNAHDWIGAPGRLGARIAPLIGAATGEVLVTDSISINLFKLLSAVLAARPGRRVILSEAGNFPTDLYIAAAVPGGELQTVPVAEIEAALNDQVAVLLLTEVDYRSARRHDMAALTAAAHRAGALVLWDLSHSAGAVAVDLTTAGADLAVGCGYKYLNGGPGAPAFLFVAERLQNQLGSPLPGWLGHAEPFAFEPEYRPAPGIARFQAGTPSILALAALEAGLATFDGVEMAALEAKSRALSELFVAAVEQRCGAEVTLASPSEAASRGSHVAFVHRHAYAVMQCLIGRGVVGDFRAPDLLRFGFAPLYNRFEEIWLAAAALGDILASGEWDRPQYHARRRVT